MTRVILGLGSNQGDKEVNLSTAVSHFSFLKNLKQSTIYKNKALLPLEAPEEWDIDFLNMAVSGDTDLSAINLLNTIQSIEILMGRSKDHKKWSPRIIDIDILIYGTHRINRANLIIPHPELMNRDFALRPAKEIEPKFFYRKS
jgi:2-amino-4-hydroxy-6-hydroxymethyldihydropteridine diphosphokinase